LNKLNEAFGEQAIDQTLWLALLPDLNLCDFNLWGTLKDICVQSSLFARTERKYLAIPRE
jgi:hypothetical protein